MKKFILILLYLSISIYLHSQNVGIGITSPLAKLHLNQTSSADALKIEHSGSIGNGIYISSTNNSNEDNSILVLHEGPNSNAMQIQQNSASPTSSKVVALFDYFGTSSGFDHYAVYSTATTNSNGWGIGTYGSGGWFGIYSDGDLSASGTKAFTIDHPSDPTNKMLKHFAIESNEVLNMYRGVAILDDFGKANIELPEYFHLINKDFSYQLTAIGTPQQPYISKEIEENQFEVKGAPGTKVSWTVYADRNDKYMQQNPQKGLDVIQKEGPRKGKYFNPELYNQPIEEGYFYKKRSKLN